MGLVVGALVFLAALAMRASAGQGAAKAPTQRPQPKLKIVEGGKKMDGKVPMVDVLPNQTLIHPDMSKAIYSLTNYTGESAAHAKSVDNDRAKWKTEGYADKFMRDMDAAVRKVAPEFGLPPEPTGVFATAHACLSSGQGRSAMTQIIFNAWGIKAGASWSGNVIQTPATEFKQVDGKDVPYKVTATWRAYASLDDCARDYLKLITRSKRYAKSAAMLKAGDDDYMAQLGRDGWYTHSTASVKAEWLSYVARVRKAIA